MNLERELLSQLTDRSELALAWEHGLRAEVFVDPICRAAFTWCLNYWQETQMQQVPTRAVLLHEFPQLKDLEPSDSATMWLVEKLQDNWARVRLQEALIQAADTSSEQPKETARSLWQQVYDISEKIAPRVTQMDLSENADTRWSWYTDGLNRTGYEGVTLGLPELDAHTQGVIPGEVVVVSAYSKVGKTVWLANAAVAAKKQGHTPIFFTLEMGLKEMATRMDALWSGVSYERLTNHTLNQDEVTRLREAREEIAELGPFKLDRPERGERTVKYLMSKARWMGCSYVLIDQLSFLDGTKDYYRDQKSKFSEIVYDLKDEATRDSSGKLPVQMAVQLNRDSVSSKEGIGMHHIAGASEVEQTVDLALALSRSRELRASNAMRLDITGARRCDLRSWLLSWHLSDRTEIAIRETLDD